MLDKLKILFITGEYPHPNAVCGGVGHYVASIGPVLARRGHEVHVLSCLGEQKRYDYVDRGVFIHSRGQVQIRGCSSINRILRVPITIESLQTGLSNYVEYRRLGVDFDVIEYPDLDTEGWVFALLHSKPIVVHLHLPIVMWYPGNKIPTNPLDMICASFLDRFAIRHADAITCPSNLLVRTLKEKGWLKNRDSKVIPHFIYSSDWANTRPVEDTQPIVLSLGWLGLNKAPEILVEAITLVRKSFPAARARFLGTSLSQREGLPYLEWIKKSASELSGCQFVGYISHDKVIDHISSSRVLAMTSWFENYPIAVLEAMAGGRPVVVTETTGVADLVRETRAGRVIPAGDPKALAEALLPFLMDADYAAEAGKRARKAVRKLLDPHEITAQREMVYRRAILSFKGRLCQRLRGARNS